jgi:diguanylate cyclase (GGDEF)-like protein
MSGGVRSAAGKRAVSFRRRLSLFFIIIVIVPMMAVAVVLFRLVTDSLRGQSDARLAAAETTAAAVFKESQDEASAAGRDIAQSAGLAQAIDQGGRDAIQDQLEILLRDVRAVRAQMSLDGVGTLRAGRGDGVGATTTTLLDSEGREVGSLKVAVTTAQDLVRELRRLTELDVVVVERGEVLAATLRDLRAADVPRRGEVELRGNRYRVTNFSAPAFDEGRVSIRLLADQRGTAAAVTKDSLFVALLLLAFLMAAFGFALWASRTLQAQIQRLLEAAKRLGGGEFGIEVPTEGNDEFAALGSEFNAMARQLEARLEELQTERARLQHAVRRVGESFATGLDREGLLRIVVSTAVDGIGADAGRATVRENGDQGALVERGSTGELGNFKNALHAVEAAVLDAREPAETTVGGLHALAHPLQPTDEDDTVLGVISVARNGRAFTEGEKELFNYLASQAAVSIENVDLHETVQRQAVTDELTGLFNHRRFQEVIDMEVERSRRFGTGLGLIMFDIDNFKSVNDTYGHLQGDLVLREVAHVLRDSAREIDEPARYGGEEMAVALPQTDLEGAYQFAERLRKRIEDLDIRLVDGDGHISVTASFGAAALPESADADKDALVAAADQALYRAKRMGKNRVVRAG